MKNSIKKLLASSLSLFLVGCNTAIIPGQVPSLSAKNNAAVTPASPAKESAIHLEKPTVNYTAEGTVSNNQESIQLKLNWLQPTGFSVQFAPYSDLKFIKVEVMGKNAAGVDSTWTTTEEYVAVSGRSATASVAGIPVVDGDLRIIKITGYDENQALLPAFSTQSYYFSETDQLAIGITVDRQSALLSQILDLLKEETFEDEDPLVENPRVLDLLKAAGDMTKLNNAFTAAMNFDMVTKTYERDPSTFDAQAVSDYILENITDTGLLIDGTAETTLETFLTDGSAQIAAGELSDIDITFSQSGGPSETRRLGENLILIINDPTSKPMQIPVGTESGLSLDIPNIAPGEWTLTLSNEAGTILGSETITVNDSGVVGNEEVDFDLSNQVKELRQVSIQLAMLDKMAKWGEPLYLNFSSLPGYKVLVDGESRYTHGAMVPVGETIVYVRTSTGKLLGESQLTVAANGSMVQAQNPLVLTGAKASEAQFVNTDTSGFNGASKIARSSNGDYTIAWIQLPSEGPESEENGGLMARIYAANGTPKTAVFQVAGIDELFFSNEGPSFLETGLQNLFDIGMDQTGNLVVTWSRTEQNFGQTNGNIYAQVYNNAGIAQDSVPFRVHREIEDDQFMPSVAVADNGQYVVTWSDDYDHNNLDDGDSISPKIRGRLLDLNGQNVNADEFYVDIPTDVDDAQVSSRTAINDNGDFVVSWVEFDESILGDDGALHAKVFNADGTPAENGDGDSVMHVTDFENPVDMFTINQENPGDGDSFRGYFFGTHDISMGTQDKNFVVSWTNAGESEVEGQNGLPPVPDSIYARHYYPQQAGPTQVFNASDTMAVSYNPNDVSPPLFFDGESYSYSMAPAVDMNANGSFVVSWTQVDVLGRDEVNRNNDPLNSPDEIDYELDFNYQSAKKMSNVSLRSRIYTRLDNDLFSPAQTNLVNPNVFRPFPFGNFRPENNEGIFEGGPQFAFLFLLSFPVADVALTDNKKPITTWQYFDFFGSLGEEGPIGDGESLMGTDISVRVYDTPILAPVAEITPIEPN